jgi:hypothetical protein
MVCGFDASGSAYVVPKQEAFGVTGDGWHFRFPSWILPGGIGDGSDEQRACDEAYGLAGLPLGGIDGGPCLDAGSAGDAATSAD